MLLHIPNDDFAIRTGRGQARAADGWTERYMVNAETVHVFLHLFATFLAYNETGDFVSRPRVPDLDGPVRAGRGELFAVRAIGHAPNLATMPRQRVHLARLQVPDLDGLVKA